MKDFLMGISAKTHDKQKKVNVMREYLQAYCLRTMFKKGRFLGLAFVGGTALRFIYNVPRFSEDLDFSLIDKEKYDLVTMLDEIKREFDSAAYTLNTKYDNEKTVNKAYLKFPELMFEAGLTHRRDQNLSIRIDVDTNPPNGAITQRTLINKYFPIAFTHHDLPSLFAGKVGAVLSRSYVKGRDYFDLGWILSRWRDITPNLDFLNAALKQTGSHAGITEKNWRKIVGEKVQTVKWEKISGEISQFAEDPSDAEMMRPENLLTLLNQAGKLH